MNRDVVIVSYARTPIGDFLGSLKKISAVDLGITAAREAIKRSGLNVDQIEDVLTGMVYKAGVKGNPARQIQIGLGIPVTAGAATIEQQCASSMRALEIAAQQIRLGEKDVCLVTGIESMSRVPYLDLNSREGLRMGQSKLEDGLLYDALIDAFNNYHMGITAERLATDYDISREEQDRFAMLSHERALKAMEDGKFDVEIVPVELKSRKGVTIVDKDEHPSPLTFEKLSKMRPAFKKENGSVTAGNASSLNDGACAIVMMSSEKAVELGIRPLAKLLSTATVGVSPEIMGIGPVEAIPEALKKINMSMDDIGYFEINEAFAAQFLAVQKVLNIDIDKVNANGSGISLGHPVGATGLRIVIALINEMKRRNEKFGVASLCVGGGPAMASVIENID
jgi:acetyl-CoA C-acetyltransferase